MIHHLINKVAILGPGLLGGSLALALRRTHPACKVALWARREEAVSEARAANIADLVSSDLAPVVEDADLIVFCVPIGVMGSLAERILPLIKQEALITDVGSVKGPVVNTLAPVFSANGHFVGSHPMAGSDQSGLGAARADLFNGAVCILTPNEQTNPSAVTQIASFWESLGCVIRFLSPEAHDENIGLVSHLPHLLAAALVDFVCAENPQSVNFCGNGFRDTTRIAGGPPEMWTEILAFNRAVIHGQLEGLIALLQSVSKNLVDGDDVKINELLRNAKIQRNRL